MKEAVEVAVEAARAAGKIQQERITHIGRITYKGRMNPVTEVDLLCEREIIGRIKQRFPDHDILAEESGGSKEYSPNKWIIDPLDGTINYSHGFPYYCVSIALEHEGEIVVGVVYNPCLDELFVAEKGKGATLNSQPISVSSHASLSESHLATGFPTQVHRVLEDKLALFCEFLKVSQGVRRPGSAALDICYLAMGRFDGFWEEDLSSWDTAAGVLMVLEAGGRVTRFDGGPFSVYDPDILASNGHIHQAMVDILQKDKG